jgi:hypothetical protein
MLETGWHALQAPDPQREYLAVVTHLPLQNWRALPAFLKHTRRLRRQLAICRGLVGYRFRFTLNPLVFWTVSVWVDEESLWTFAHGTAHVAAVNALLGDTGHTRVAHWKVLGSGIPLPWPQIRLKILSKEKSAPQ